METGLERIGRIAKLRRERLGLRQHDLASLGGPKVATVGKFERGAQENFPPRTQRQMEIALGWTPGVVEEFIAAVDEGSGTVDDWEYDLIHDDARPSVRVDVAWPEAGHATPGVEQAIAALSGVLRAVPQVNLNAAVHDGLMALLPHLHFEGGDGDADSTKPGGSAPTNLRPVDDLHVDEAAYNPEGE
jgi:transcriptional regulator with XRE-family HTH domain